MSRRPTPTRAPFRPRLEALDERVAPAVFTVTNTADAGGGSLRDAIDAANVTPGADQIRFAIGAVGSSHTIQPLSQLPDLTDSVTIDGWSQGVAGYTGLPLITLDGSSAPGAYGFKAYAPVTGFAFRGLSVGRFTAGIVVWSDDITIQGCHLGVDATGTVATGNGQGVGGFGDNLRLGGTGPGEGNLISGNGHGANVAGQGVIVQGNKFGTDITGTVAIAGSHAGLIVGGDGPLIGGTEPGAGNLISGHTGDGLTLSPATNGRVQGNVIGLDATGMHALGNLIGIRFQNGSDLLIGGTSAAARNVISGNRGVGVFLEAPRTKVQGNYIGPNVAGGHLPHGTEPATVSNAGGGIGVGSGSVIGGAEPGAGNLIAGNGRHGIITDDSNVLIQGNVIRDNGPIPFTTGTPGPGVLVLRTASGVSILGNSISNNGGSLGGLAIDLSGDLSNRGDGVTGNDDLDADSGPNDYQNFPVLSAATCSAVTGTLHSTPGTSFRIEFFANSAIDPSGYGEGELYLGAVEITTDATGIASFTAPVAAPGAGKPYLTATATNLTTGDTSEFSRAKAIPAVTVVGGSFVYDGQPHPATGSVIGVNGEDLGTPTFTYSYTDNDGNVVTLAGPPVEPGYYTVTATYPGNETYLAASATATITIALPVELLTDLSKVFKAGRTIPIKLRLTDAAGNNLSSPDIAVAAIRLERVNADGTRTQVALNDAGGANPDSLFRYDAALGGYIFNLSTKGLTAGTYALTIAWTLNDVYTEQELGFNLI